MMRYPFEVITHFETKSLEDGSLLVEGYASTFGNVDRHKDVIDHKAFDACMEQYMQNPVLLAFHDQNKPIGTVAEAHLDEKGLYVVGHIPDSSNPEIKAIRKQIEAGVLRSFSIGGYFHRKSMGDVNLIHQVDLVEISVVAIPANPWASFTLSGSMQKSLEHKSLFHPYETKEIPEEKGYALRPFQEEETHIPQQSIPMSVYVEGANTPQFIGYWFGVSAPGLKQYEFNLTLPDEQSAEQTMHRLKEYSDRAGVTVMVNTPFDWKEVQ
jgi:HK97 family phage prohead protease